MARRLPVIEAEGKKWIVDKRLGELRNAGNPHEHYTLSAFGMEVAEALDNVTEYITKGVRDEGE